jgi:hypothetical protein
VDRELVGIIAVAEPVKDLGGRQGRFATDEETVSDGVEMVKA